MFEDLLEFGDPSVVECKPTKYELKVGKQSAAVQPGDIAKFALIDAHEDDHRNRKTYLRSICKVRAKAAKANKSS